MKKFHFAGICSPVAALLLPLKWIDSMLTLLLLLRLAIVIAGEVKSLKLSIHASSVKHLSAQLLLPNTSLEVDNHNYLNLRLFPYYLFLILLCFTRSSFRDGGKYLLNLIFQAFENQSRNSSNNILIISGRYHHCY